MIAQRQSTTLLFLGMIVFKTFYVNLMWICVVSIRQNIAWCNKNKLLNVKKKKKN